MPLSSEYRLEMKDLRDLNDLTIHDVQPMQDDSDEEEEDRTPATRKRKRFLRDAVGKCKHTEIDRPTKL